MKRFRPPPGTVVELVSYIRDFVLRVDREFDRTRKEIPKQWPGIDEVLKAVRDDTETKDAIYRYIKEREAKENVQR